MTDQDCKDLQRFRELLGKLSDSNKEKAVEFAAQMLVERMAKAAAK